MCHARACGRKAIGLPAPLGDARARVRCAHAAAGRGGAGSLWCVCAFQRAEAVAFELERTKERKRRSVPTLTCTLPASVNRYSARNGPCGRGSRRIGLGPRRRSVTARARDRVSFGRGSHLISCRLERGLRLAPHICVVVCSHAHTHTHTHPRAHTRTHTNIYAYMHVYGCIYVCRLKRSCAQRTYVYEYVCAHAHARARTHERVHAYGRAPMQAEAGAAAGARAAQRRLQCAGASPRRLRALMSFISRRPRNPQIRSSGHGRVCRRRRGAGQRP